MSFRRIVLGVALSLAMVGLAFAQSHLPITVKIIGLNDFHGNLQSPGNFSTGPGAPSVPSGGVDILAGYVADLKSKNPNTCPEGGCQGFLTVVQDHFARLGMSDDPRWVSAWR
jgi:5'-nucleotidase